jgi:hypothetical protein
MIEFPCDFPIKIIFKNEPGAQDELLAIIHRHPEMPDSAFAFQPSQNGNFVSITAVVCAQNQTSLDDLYRELTQNPHIKMVL